MTTEWPIDGIPDDALPRLLPRPLVYTETGTMSYDPQDKDMPPTTGFFVMVSLRDCAPLLGTWPPDLDELTAVATRLLLVPGGPLVLEDGRTTRLRRRRPGETAFGHDRILGFDIGLVCYTTDMARSPEHVPQPIGRAHRAGLCRLVRREMEHYFRRRDDYALEMVDRHLKKLAHPRTDTMLAGVPAKEGDHGEA